MVKTLQSAVFLVGLCFSACDSEAQAAPFITNGLVAFYPFNGNVNDAWGTNNGTIQGDTIWTNGVSGSATNNALYFDGATRVVIQDSPSLDPTNGITIAAWFTANNWNGDPRLVCKGDSEYDFHDETGSFQFSLNIGAVTNGAADAALPSVGVWHHAVGTYDGASVEIYFDGKMAARQPAKGIISIAGTPLLNIGAKPDSSNPLDFFNGAISDVAIYNRALFPLEVAELYQSSLLAGIVLIPGIIVAGNSNQNYSIQYVTNLSSTNWVTLASNVVVQGNCFVYPDTNAACQSQRFYRVVGQ